MWESGVMIGIEYIVAFHRIIQQVHRLVLIVYIVAEVGTSLKRTAVCLNGTVEYQMSMTVFSDCV